MKKIFYRSGLLCLALALILTGCTPATFDDLHCEGESEMRKLTAELRRIESPEDAHRASKRLKKRFNRIADLLIATRKFQGYAAEPVAAGEELFAEMARVYEIPGVREMVEEAQFEAVRRLDRKRL